MINVYISHLGESPLRDIEQPIQCRPSSLKDILLEIESDHPGFLDLILESDRETIQSSVLIYQDIEVTDDGRWLESSDTIQITDLVAEVYEDLLIAIFNPDRAMTLLTQALTQTDERLEHANGSNNYRAFMSGPNEYLGNQPLWLRGEPEELYPFREGQPISDLVTNALISIERDELIPERLRHAIANLWELGDNFRLRLFQEEVLMHILHQLRLPGTAERHPLLLSIPTGGGKTEAFLIPLIAHLYDRKMEALQDGNPLSSKIRALILYPTRALANDQAKRITEILYALNSDLVEDNKVTVGVLTGDTPNSGYNFRTEKSLLQVCPACSSVLTSFPKRESANGAELHYARCSCGAEIDFFRLTRWDILNAPPDVLITSPDMINRTLQSPRYHRVLFSDAIETVIFDEIHMYEGVFGCNVAHLLRRFEEASEHRPLYIGVSATIRNAKALASLIFNAALDDVKYLRPARPDTPITDEERPYINYDAPPNRYRYHYAVAPTSFGDRFQKTVTATLNIADALDHMIRDPHFRKTLIFANFRQDTDDIVRFLRDQEARYYIPYIEHVLPKLMNALNSNGDTAGADLTQAEADIARAIDRWYRQAKEIDALYKPPLEIGWHRGGLEKEERIKAVNRFSSTRRLSASTQADTDWPIDVMAATKTLELGIDIGDVTTVINNTAPFSVNEYVQRIGRGGRRRDSLALTVVNPKNPLDFYFLRHFEHYVHPEVSDFEDAPIIISNQDVLRSHLYARLLDHLAYYLNERRKSEIQVADLKNYRVQIAGEPTGLAEENVEVFANAVFDCVLSSEVINHLQTWIRREADVIPGVQPSDISAEQLRQWWVDKVRHLHTRIRKGDLVDNDYISGWHGKARDFVPDMRSAGPQVGVYLIREKGDDELRDTLSRDRAVSSRPVGGFASQGSVTFHVEGIKTRDVDAEQNIKEVFATHPKAVTYFHRMFSGDAQGSPFPDRPMNVLIQVDFQTPRDLSVKYHPYRFYCPSCGATYSDKRPGDERCSMCGHELRQLTEIYVCGGCGKIYLPPVPKVCINPGCVAQAEHDRDHTPFTEAVKKVGKYDRHKDYFRFTALPRLKWQCRRCGTEINYHAYYELPQDILRQLNAADWNEDKPASIARRFLYFPESHFLKGYDDNWHRARFYCKPCRDADKYHKIHVTNIPTHRSVTQEYVIHDESYTPPLEHALGQWTFDRVRVISLARELYRRFFSYPDQETRIFPALLFPESNSYLANLYGSHAAFLKVSDALEEFLDTNDQVQDYIRGYEDVCLKRVSGSTVDDEEDQDLEGGEMTSPHPALLEWERGRKPDPRRMWCDVVRGVVPDKVCKDDACEHCRINAFDRRRFVRYLVLHTLQHALINAMPRFTGVNKNEIRGYIYPNDKREYDLALVDRIVGGSGCLYLLRANWDVVWEMTGELLEAAQQDQSQLLLPYTCIRYNRDLCAPLAFLFYEFVNK